MSDELEDTVPMEISKLGIEPDAPWAKHLGWDANGDGEVDEYEANVPEPLVLRGLILTVLGLVGAVIGKQLDVSWIDQAITAYALVAPIGLSLWARRHVSPVKK
ncbi:membrane protein [Mycobacterium phage Stephig9]|uniref:Membrane protein n=1 Tax=Mycobacterium phage Stephig9 TaxID=2591224 RepID=A0A514DH83_9CAUD|nr:membrane protein [Mycobacterium phage Stephig9]